MIGVSFFIMVCTQDDVFPQLSDAVHLRVMVESHAVPDLASEKVMVILV